MTIEVVHLLQILAGSARVERLDRAALDLATIQYPDLDPQPSLDLLNELASRLGDRLRNFNDGRDFVEQAQKYLFEELGYHGNQADYFDPLNSCLNQVLERRTGIPIALSVMYMEIARRLHMPVFGVDLPRHFVLQFDDGRYATFIDPYHGGRTISAGECFSLANATVADPSLLRRASKKRIVLRMLHNMHHVYVRTGDFPRALQALDLIIEGDPGAGVCYRQRAAVAIELRHFQSAREDLKKYLMLDPGASDRSEILRQLEQIHQWMAQMN